MSYFFIFPSICLNILSGLLFSYILVLGGFEYDQRKIPAVQTSPLIVHIPPSPTYCDLSDSVESIQVI